MKRIVPYLTFAFALCNCQSAFAGRGVTYGLIRESSLIILSLTCLAVTWLIFRTLQGGSLGTPWLFFVGGFALVGIEAVIQLFDVMKIVVYEYDLGLVSLLLSAGSMILMMTGLILYKKGLQ